MKVQSPNIRRLNRLQELLSQNGWPMVESVKAARMAIFQPIHKQEKMGGVISDAAAQAALKEFDALPIDLQRAIEDGESDMQIFLDQLWARYQEFQTLRPQIARVLGNNHALCRAVDEAVEGLRDVFGFGSDAPDPILLDKAERLLALQPQAIQCAIRNGWRDQIHQSNARANLENIARGGQPVQIATIVVTEGPMRHFVGVRETVISDRDYPIEIRILKGQSLADFVSAAHGAIKFAREHWQDLIEGRDAEGVLAGLRTATLQNKNGGALQTPSFPQPDSNGKKAELATAAA